MEMNERIELLEKDAAHLRTEAYVMRSLVAALLAGKADAVLDDPESFVQEALDRLPGGDQAHVKPGVDADMAKAAVKDIVARAKA